MIKEEEETTLLLKIGEEVWLSAINLKLSCPSQKLGPKFIGPFKIKKMINPVAFELALPSSYKIHPVFHASLLKPTVPSPFPEREELPPPPVLVEGKPEFGLQKKRETSSVPDQVEGVPSRG